jgi:hypothetical protein
MDVGDILWVWLPDSTGPLDGWTYIGQDVWTRVWTSPVPPVDMTIDAIAAESPLVHALLLESRDAGLRWAYGYAPRGHLVAPHPQGDAMSVYSVNLEA